MSASVCLCVCVNINKWPKRGPSSFPPQKWAENHANATHLNLPELNEGGTVLLQCVADELGGLGVTLGADNVRNLLLLGPLDKEARALCLLLCNLLQLDSVGEFLAKSQMGDGDVVEDNVKVFCAGVEGLAALEGNNLTLRNQLGRIVLGLQSSANHAEGEQAQELKSAHALCLCVCVSPCLSVYVFVDPTPPSLPPPEFLLLSLLHTYHNGLEDFVTDGGQDTLSIICTVVLQACAKSQRQKKERDVQTG